ncbi:nascent polypeptide-associated complex subunit alpha [Halalkaliarchaeum desulfuricum]|uniref:Nascent polypeptide-associated complex protein n=1 Tax=Halalkaliarchaeum desulfuricum TaxID=2055893 RepID=A0A343THH9_9EURY|nr:nascent polypeptide-associated complex protein [Halalkaliarchaeum desulfuricum]AUX08551.1 nascent polypeptide-associated complex subunit alpha [Halalkaliarchaeum desulfuricum]
MFGGGGMNPRKMKQMMEQMGIDVTELDATEVVIRTEGEEDLVFDAPQVTRMDAQGQQTYQIVGEPTRQEATAVAGDEAEAAETDEGDPDDGGIPDSDVEIVAARAGVPESTAREALEAEDGDLAAAINRLE